MTTPTHVEVLATTLRRLLIDGGQFPPAQSAAFKELEAAITTMVNAHPGIDEDYRLFGAHAMRALIDRGHGSIVAEQTLRRFIQPGGDL